MIHLAILLAALVGFGSLALATDRAQENVFARRFERRVRLPMRVLGWTALLAALALAVSAYGWAYGLVSYSGHTSLAAALVFVALIANARRKRST